MLAKRQNDLNQPSSCKWWAIPYPPHQQNYIKFPPGKMTPHFTYPAVQAQNPPCNRLLLLYWEASNQTEGSNLAAWLQLKCALNPHQQFFVEIPLSKTQLLLHPLANSARAQPRPGWLWCVWGVRLGGPDKFGPPVTICLWITTPQTSIFVKWMQPQNGAAFPFPCQFRPCPAMQRLIVVHLNFWPGGLTKFCPPVAFGYALQPHPTLC